MTSEIGTLNEKPLHAALKSLYALPGDQFEMPVDGYIIDILRGDLLIEIQTGNFFAIKKKLQRLVVHHPLLLIYPVAREKWLVKTKHQNGNVIIQRRKSPKRGSFEDLFYELVRFPELIIQPNFSLEVLLIEEEELRHYDAKKNWRRKGWVTDERRILQVLAQKKYQQPEDFAEFLPYTLPQSFTTSDLASSTHKPLRLAQKMAYCLRKMNIIEPVGKTGRSITYTRLITNKSPSSIIVD
jgi:hypothetical protein